MPHRYIYQYNKFNNMALTLAQELTLFNESEDTATGVGPTTYPLSELVYQAAVGFSVTLLTTTKDTTGDDLAASYVGKVTSVATRVNRRTSTGDTVLALKKILVSLIGDSATWSQVTGASDTAWETFITANIAQVFEIGGGVIKQEKDAYTAL